MTDQPATKEDVKDDPYDVRDPAVEEDRREYEASVSTESGDAEADVDDSTDTGDDEPERDEAEADSSSEEDDTSSEEDGESGDEPDEESDEVEEDEKKDKIREVEPEPFEGEINPAEYLDEDLAKTVLRQQRLINTLMERVEAAGISDPIQGAVESVAETFPEVFGKEGSLDAKQQSARDQLIESAMALKSDYQRKGRPSPGWEKLIKMAMNVDHPDLSERMNKRQTRKKRRESQRIPRPTARQSDLTPEERAVAKLREKMLKMEFGD